MRGIRRGLVNSTWLAIFACTAACGRLGYDLAPIEDASSDIDTVLDTTSGSAVDPHTDTDTDTDKESNRDTVIGTDADTGPNTSSDTITASDTDLPPDSGTMTESNTATGTEVSSDTITASDTDIPPGSDTTTETTITPGTDTDTDTVNGIVIGTQWVKIPAGSFWMGSPDGDCPPGYPGGSGAECEVEPGRNDSIDLNEELHPVTVTRDFEIMRNEVTQGDFESAMGWNPSFYSGCGPDCPVESVHWYDALAYANTLSTQAGLPPCYTITAVTCEEDDAPGAHDDYMACHDGSDPSKGKGIRTATVTLHAATTPYGCLGYRLPTEAEWEYAIRAGSSTAIHPSEGNDGTLTQTATCSTLDNNLDQIGWYCGNAPKGTSSPVRGKEPNAWGLFDMSGNVQEWVWDWEAPYTADPTTDPAGPDSGTYRILRGGYKLSTPAYCRSAVRKSAVPYGGGNTTGFRLSRSIP